MALQLTVDKLDSVPEAVRSMYLEREGKYHLDVDGVPDTTKLMSALQSERELAKTADKARKELETRFSGVDPDKYRKIIAQFEGDEEAQLIAAGKVDEVVAKRSAKRDVEWQKKIDAIAVERDSEKGKAAKFLGRVLDDQIRAAVNGKVHDKAVEDALFRARLMFTLDDNGYAVQKDESGSVVIGKDGKSSFTPAEWIESMRDSAPHWFPATGSGSGAQQSNGSGGNGKTISRKQYEAMSPLEQRASYKAGIKVVDK